jgi:hypothetical protein
MEDYTQYDEYARSGRKAVEHFLNENSHLSFKALKEKLHRANISLEDQTIRNYMTDWRLYSKNGAVPRLHFSGLAGLDSGFAPELWETGLCSRWKISRNKNRHRFWDEAGIRLCWHRNGKVLFRFKGSKPEGYLLSVFSHAFFPVLLSTGMPEREVLDFLYRLFKERYRVIEEHYVHDTGQPLPRTKIKDFEASLGMEVDLGDGSHPTCAEFKFRVPFWASEVRKAAEKTGEVIDKLGDNVLPKLSEEIKSHLELIKTWKEENERHRGKGKISFDDASVVSVTSMIECDPGWCVRCLRRRVLPYSANTLTGWDRICKGCAQALLKKLRDGGDRRG